MTALSKFILLSKRRHMRGRSGVTAAAGARDSYEATFAADALNGALSGER
jgi:hypothetical protein